LAVAVLQVILMITPAEQLVDNYVPTPMNNLSGFKILT